MRTSYHNHSKWSDGIASIEQMALAAQNAKLDEFGISDHYIEAPFDNSEIAEWCLDVNRVDEYVEDALDVKKRLETDTFKVKIGLEVDFFQENADEVAKKLKKYPFDYLIGAVHFSGTFPIDLSAESWKPLEQEKIDEIWRIYWKKIRLAAASGHYSFIAHLDLPKKFLFLPEYDYSDDAFRALRAAKKADVAIEINTAGWAKPCKSPYPAANILAYACEIGVPALVSADAHEPEHVDRFYDEAEERLRQAGYRKTACVFDKFVRTIP